MDISCAHPATTFSLPQPWLFPRWRRRPTWTECASKQFGVDSTNNRWRGCRQRLAKPSNTTICRRRRTSTAMALPLRLLRRALESRAVCARVAWCGAVRMYVVRCGMGACTCGPLRSSVNEARCVVVVAPLLRSRSRLGNAHAPHSAPSCALPTPSSPTCAALADQLKYQEQCKHQPPSPTRWYVCACVPARVCMLCMWCVRVSFVGVSQ